VRFAAAAAAVALGAAGCPGVERPPEPPAVEVIGAELAGDAVRIALSVLNPNPRAARLEAVDWTWRGAIEERRGRCRLALALPARAATRLAFSVAAPAHPGERYELGAVVHVHMGGPRAGAATAVGVLASAGEGPADPGNTPSCQP
jgi:hypothetical protein